MIRLSVLALALGSLTTGCANIHEVDPGVLYRSAQLDEAGFRALLKEQEIRTVLRLRGGRPGDEGYDALAVPAEELGVALEHVPMTARRMPPREQLVRIWEVMERAERPLLVHCKAGADRTGLGAAIAVLHSTDGDLRAAREQLHVSYLHLGWGSTDAMDRVLDLYEPYAGIVDFGRWARHIYEPGATTD